MADIETPEEFALAVRQHAFGMDLAINMVRARDRAVALRVLDEMEQLWQLEPGLHEVPFTFDQVIYRIMEKYRE